ncbi:MAG: hypothetical protein ACJ8OJ_19880 [Povalibacter sp.]
MSPIGPFVVPPAPLFGFAVASEPVELEAELLLLRRSPELSLKRVRSLDELEEFICCEFVLELPMLLELLVLDPLAFDVPC